MNLVSKREREIPPRNRLESWLLRKIQAGVLRALPQYYPLHGPGGGCPEQYAQTLLTDLRTSEGDVLALERLKDDGRAFRSWTESVLPSVSIPQGGQVRGVRLMHGFAS